MVLSVGMSRRHRANPLASLRAYQIFGIPVLFSGVASLILNKQDLDILSHHVKKTTEGLLKLHSKTPEPFIYLISGTLPAKAILHRRQLSLFSMICRLPGNILNRIARQILLSSKTEQTWFGQVETISLQYGLPHPLQLLENPPCKEEFKQLVRHQVADYWQQHYRICLLLNSSSQNSVLCCAPTQYSPQPCTLMK